MPDSVVRTRAATLAEVKKPAAEGRLYAILDACDAPLLYQKIRELAESDVACLPRGNLAPEVEAQAPHIVRVDPKLLDWIHETVWQTPWGIFLVANTDLRALRKHLRKLLIVQDAQGDAVYFRFYDPRVLATYLPTCTDSELRVFLGPALAYAVGDPKGGGVTYYLREGPVAAGPIPPPPGGIIVRMRAAQIKAFSDAQAAASQGAQGGQDR
jgi:hypothetical protein